MARGRAYGLCNMTKCLGQISFPRIPFPGYIQLGKAMRETLVWLMQGRSGATTHTYCLSPRPPECHKATTNATLHKLGTLLQLLWLLDQLCKFKQLRKRPASAETTPPRSKSEAMKTFWDSACPHGFHLTLVLPSLHPSFLLKCLPYGFQDATITPYRDWLKNPHYCVRPNPCNKSLHFIHTTTQTHKVTYYIF